MFLQILFLLAFQICMSNGGNVLVIPSMVSPSHKMGMVPLADTLAERGHHVLFWAAVAAEDGYIPKKADWKQPTGKTNDKWLNEMFVYKNESTLFTLPWNLAYSVPGVESIFAYTVIPFCEHILANQKKDFMEVLSKKWDLIIIDELFNPCGYLLTNLAKSPVVTYVSTSCLTHHSSYRNGQPTPRSYHPFCGLDGYADQMSFLQRAHNFLLHTAAYSIDQVVFSLMSRRLGVFFPEVKDVAAGLMKPDMVFFYFRQIADYATPRMPNMVYVGGLHVRSGFKPIPDDVQKAIERGNRGFIMVSTGHWARFEHASLETRSAFMEAFTRTVSDGFSIIWQFSGNITDTLPDGVFRFDWLPQRELLVHPKCKAFLSHCGCNSALEAIMNGVPVIGLGLFADQIYGASLMQSKGISIRLNKKRLSADIIYKTIIAVATNETMRAKSKQFASMVSHEPMKVMDRAIYWSEYLMRHKGGKWLRSNLPTTFSSSIKYYCIDVITVMLAIVTSISVVVFKIVKQCWRLVFGGNTK